MPIINVGDNENNRWNRWKRNAKKIKQRQRGTTKEAGRERMAVGGKKL